MDEMANGRTVAEIMEALRAPFPAEDVEWRVGRESEDGTRVSLLAYIDSRAVQERLDEVLGIDGWQTQITITERGVLCALNVRLGSSWVIRTDGADYPDFEAFKGGVSGALKRAAAQLGIGRYLYNLPETWVSLVPDRKQAGLGAIYHRTKRGQVMFAPVPTLPAWALPGGSGRPPRDASRQVTPGPSLAHAPEWDMPPEKETPRPTNGGRASGMKRIADALTAIGATKGEGRVDWQRAIAAAGVKNYSALYALSEGEKVKVAEKLLANALAESLANALAESAA